MNKKLVGIVVGFVVLALAIAGAVAVYVNTRPDTSTDLKSVTVQISYDDVSKTVELETKAEYLRGALEEKQLISGDESAYGLFVKTVDGRTVDDTKQEWWCFTKGGETMSTGVDTTVIADGETYEITLKAGYDF